LWLATLGAVRNGPTVLRHVADMKGVWTLWVPSVCCV